MLNDVWWSVDGNVWRLATRGAPFSRRYGHHVVIHDGKFWLIGGYDYTYQNDIWVSEDGVHWEQVLGGPIFFARRHAAAVAFDGKIWMIGGIFGDSQIPGSILSRFKYFHQNDVWNSIDGVTWNRSVLHAAFRPVGRTASVVFGEKIWVMGGTVHDVFFPQTDIDINEVWFSEAGSSSASSSDVWLALE